MEKVLFLRGQVPTDRDPRQIMFDKLEDCDDVWTQIAYHLSKQGYGEVWYWGGNRKTVYKENFIERWMTSFKTHKFDFSPDVIFSRGGFADYDKVMERNPNAYKIYYGAGKRFYPKNMFLDYDLILVDTESQLSEVRRIFPNIKSSMWVKPAADNIFKPYENLNKKYDVIFVGNYNKRVDKGHDWFMSRASNKFKILCPGIVTDKVRNRYPNVDFSGWVKRSKLPEMYSTAKVAACCCGTVDSCPRVIPEALACNCPLIILDRVNFDFKVYINSETGIISNENDFMDNLENIINNYDQYSPNRYYSENLSVEHVVNQILELVKESTN